MIDPAINKRVQKDFNFVSIDDSILPIGGTYELSTTQGECNVRRVRNPEPIRLIQETPIRRWIRNTNPDFVFRIGRSVLFISGIIGIASGSIYVLYSIGKFVLGLIALVEWKYVFAGIASVLALVLLLRLVRHRYSVRSRTKHTPDPTTDPNWVGYGHLTRREVGSGDKQQINIVLVNGEGKITDFQKQ